MNLIYRQIVVRVPESDHDLLKKVSKARGEALSDFVRRALKKELGLLGYLSAEEVKALGLRVETIYESEPKEVGL